MIARDKNESWNVTITGTGRDRIMDCPIWTTDGIIGYSFVDIMIMALNGAVGIALWVDLMNLFSVSV